MTTRKVTLKVGQLLQEPPNGLRYVLQVLCREPLRYQYARPLSKLRDIIDKESILAAEQRLKLIQQYGIPARMCDACKGTGKVDGVDCPACEAKGFIKDEKSQNWQANPAICGTKWPDFVKDYNQFILSDCEIEAPVIDLPETFDISPEKVSILRPFLAEDNDPVAEAEKIVRG